MRSASICSFISLVLVASCYTPPHDDSSTILHIAAQPQEQVEFPRMEFSSGAVAATEPDLERELALRYHNGFTETRTTFADPPASSCNNGTCWGQLHVPIFETGYSFEVIGSHPGFVGGCIKRHLVHVSIIFRKAGTTNPIRDLHLAHWRQNNQYCLGAYISPTKWSKCTCFNNPSNWKSTQLARDFSHELKELIRETLDSTGMFMNQNAAAITAAGLAPIIIWALPIPPPPL